MAKVVTTGRFATPRWTSTSSRLLTILEMFSILLVVVQGSPDIKVVNVEPQQYIPDTQIQDQELYLVTNVTRLELHCEAHFPVQWDFAGDTSPMQLQIRAVRKTGAKMSDPTFSAQLIIYRVSSSITGSYYCRSVLNHNKFAKVHIFAQDKGYRGQDPVLIKYGQTFDRVLDNSNPSMIIPCSTWDPKTQISLFKKAANTEKFELVEPTDAYTYDPKIGFNLNLTQLEEPWGQYMCSPAMDRTFDRVYVNLLRKPDFKFVPNTKMVEIVQGEKLLLRCMGLEEVSIFVNGEVADDARVKLTKEFNPEAEFPYVANLVFSNLTPADGSMIECIQRPGSSNAQSLHLWKYRVVGEFDEKRRGIVKYHSRRTKLDWFACWARTSVSPDLVFVGCTNPMECQIRGHCLQNGNKCDPALVQLCSGGCAHSTIENQTGILQCKGDGVFQQIKQFVGASGNYVYNSMVDAPKEEQLQLSGRHAYKVGSVGEFTCKGSTFLYAGGFRWGIKMRGQPLEILEPSSEEVVAFEETFLPTGHILAKATLRLNSSKLTQVDCIAPFWNTTAWDTRIHSLHHQG